MICVSWWVISLKGLSWKRERVESSVIPYMNAPHLYSCLYSPGLAASQKPVNTSCRQSLSFPCFSFQFWLVMHYLSEMTEEQTLVMYSGHPLGLFPSHQHAPCLIITNGMVGSSILFFFHPISFSSVGWFKILFILSEFTIRHWRTWDQNSAAFFPAQLLPPHVCWSAVMEETTFLLENLCSESETIPCPKQFI